MKIKLGFHLLDLDTLYIKMFFSIKELKIQTQLFQALLSIMDCGLLSLVQHIFSISSYIQREGGYER